MEFSAESQKILLDRARWAILRYFRQPGQENSPVSNDPMLAQPAGCFVSLHRRPNHALRGCIGTLDAVRPLWDAIPGAASSALEDPRFQRDPITANELSQLDIELSVLSPMRAVATPLDFEPREHGIVLAVYGRNGCFLPQVGRETGWPREQLLARLCTEKLGVPALAWKDPTAKLKIFSAIVLGPVPLL